MPDDRKKTKTTFNYSSKDSNREELINFIERSIKQFIKFFVLSLEEIAYPPKARTRERPSLRDFAYSTLAIASHITLLMLFLFVLLMLFVILSGEGDASVVLAIVSGILTSIIMFFFLSIAEIGFSLRAVEDKITEQNKLQEKQIRLLERQLEMLEDSQKRTKSNE